MEARRRLVKNGCLQEARLSFAKYLLDLGYSKKSIRNYKWTIRCLDQFMFESDLREYSYSVGKDFLDNAVRCAQHTSSVLKMMGYVVRRFNCFMEKGAYILVVPRVSKDAPPQFAEGLSKYLAYQRMQGLRESTIEQHRYNIQKALLKLDAAGIQNFSEIRPEDIYGVFEKTSNKQGFCSPLRGFLHYLFRVGTIEFDYSAFVPSVRKARPIPSIYTADETESLLDRGEANVNARKRNNAIILLALRLGLRSGDIAGLKIADVDFQGKTISFIQQKTPVLQRLELLPEIEDALGDYIFTVRSPSDIPNIFLTLKPPLRAITTRTINSLINTRFEKAGIDTKGRKHGPHALRMTLASELVAEKVPYDAVRKILGHENPVSIKHYVQFDIESLRSCAIEIPSVTGKLAAYMVTRAGDSQ